MTMTYIKPAEVKYVDMCIYIDNVMKRWYAGEKMTVDEEDTVYKYIYHLYYNAACREHYFSRIEDYDEYAIWCATKAFLRLIDNRQFTGELDPIKSILNYMKATSYGWKLKWQAETFQTVFSEEYTKNFDSIAFTETFQSNVKRSNREGLIDDVYGELAGIPSLLDDIIKNTPYRNDKLLCRNLRMSVFLSLIEEAEKAKSCRNISKYAYKYDNIVKLWGLSPEMTDTVTILLNKIKAKTADNIKYAIRKFDINTDITEEIKMSNIVQKETSNG